MQAQMEQHQEAMQGMSEEEKQRVSWQGGAVPVPLPVRSHVWHVEPADSYQSGMDAESSIQQDGGQNEWQMYTLVCTRGSCPLRTTNRGVVPASATGCAPLCHARFDVGHRANHSL